MAKTNFKEFRDQYSLTNYPFVDTASCTDRTNTVTLPRGILLDASLYIPGANSLLYLSKLEVLSNKIIITVSDTSGKRYAVGTRYNEDTTNSILLKDVHGFTVGILVSEAVRWSFFHSLPEGTYEFTVNATRFVDKCCANIPSMGLTSLGLENGDALTGDIWLCGKDGVVVRAENQSTIRIDVVGEVLTNRTLCDDDQFSTPNYVLTINGQKADKYGNMQIFIEKSDDKDNIVRLVSSPEHIVISAVGAANK